MKTTIRTVMLLLAAWAIPWEARAQIDPTGTISTADTDCSPVTSCVGWSSFELPSFGAYIDVGTSGTFVFEVSQNATAITNGTWVGIDDSTGDASATVDGAYYFGNTGFLWFRVRAAAISGAATVSQARGYSSGGGGGVVSGEVTTVLDEAFGDFGAFTPSGAIATINTDTDGNVIEPGTFYTIETAFDPIEANGLMLFGHGSTGPCATSSLDELNTPLCVDRFGAVRMWPSISGVDLTATSTSLNVNVTNTSLANHGGVADETAFTYATTTTLAIGAVAESTTDTLADGLQGAVSMTLDRSLHVQPRGYLSGGAVPVTMKSDNTNNDDETAICTGACTVYSITAFNHAAASAFFRCENDTTGNTSPGSETASDGEPDFEIPGNATGAGFTVSFPVGISFSTALTCWIATGEAATDATDAATDDVTVLVSRVQ